MALILWKNQSRTAPRLQDVKCSEQRSGFSVGNLCCRTEVLILSLLLFLH